MSDFQVLSSSASVEWYTPVWLFQNLNDIFKFTLDPCAINSEVALCETFYSPEQDGLTQTWENHVVYCNPPYSDNAKWLKKCAESGAKTVVTLIPARVGAKYFHEHAFSKATEILFMKGRLKFSNSKNSAPFDTVLILWGEGSFDGLEHLGKRMLNK